MLTSFSAFIIGDDNNQYLFRQRTEVVDDASWVMGFLDIIDPALDSVKKLLNLDQQSGPGGQKNMKSTTDPSGSSIRSSTGEEYSETSATGGPDATTLSSNDAEDHEEATKIPQGSFDLDSFIKRRLGLDPTELDAVLEDSDPKGVVSQRRRRLPRKPLPLLPIP